MTSLSRIGFLVHTTKEEGLIINAKLFVGNLNFSTTQSELERLFSEVGEVVEVFLPTDRDSGRPRGFAFVQYADQSAADSAIEKFDGYELDGRNLRVNEAQEKRPAPRGFSDGGPPPMFGAPRRPKGSRRNLRGKKRSLS